MRLEFPFTPVVLHLDMKASRLLHLRCFLPTRLQCRGLLMIKTKFKRRGFNLGNSIILSQEPSGPKMKTEIPVISKSYFCKNDFSC